LLKNFLLKITNFFFFKKRFLFWFFTQEAKHWCLGPLGLIFFIFSFFAFTVYPNLLLKKIFNIVFSVAYGHFSQIKLVGPGYKIWVVNSFLFFKLGYCVLLAQQIKRGILAKATRQRLVLFALQKVVLNSFVEKILNLRLVNVYSGKGILQKPITLKLGKLRK